MELNAIEAKDIRITGGKVIAVCDEFQGTAESSKMVNGLYSSGTIVLGWTNKTDSIKASSYTFDEAGQVSIVSGKKLTDGKNT